MQDEPHLVGGRGPAAGAVRGELGLVQLDQVLGLAALAVELGVEPLGRAGRDVGHHVADVEAQAGGLDAGGDAALPGPRPGPMRGLGEAAHRVLVLDGALDADRIGDVLELVGQRLGAGEAEDIVDAVRLAEVHDLGPAIVAVAADGDPGRGPVAADRPDETAQMAAHLLARRCLARPQDHRDRAGRGRVVDVDRQKAALVVMGVEQRQLLTAVDDIERVVDVEHHRRRRRGIAGTVELDQDPAEPQQIAQARRVLPARHGRLAHQVGTALGQAPAGELERGVGAQTVEIVGVRVAAGDGEDAREQDLGQRVNHPRRVTAIGDHGGELPGDPHPSRRRGEQHHATVRRQAPAVERGGELLAPDGWKRERQYPIVGHGGCGRLDGVDGVGFSTRILRHIKELRHTRQRRRLAVMNKAG